MHGPGKMFRSFQSALDKGLVDDHLGSNIRQITSLLPLHLLSHGLEVARMRSTPTEMQSINENDFECFASTGGNTSETMSPSL